MINEKMWKWVKENCTNNHVGSCGLLGYEHCYMDFLMEYGDCGNWDELLIYLVDVENPERINENLFRHPMLYSTTTDFLYKKNTDGYTMGCGYDDDLFIIFNEDLIKKYNLESDYELAKKEYKNFKHTED